MLVVCVVIAYNANTYKKMALHCKSPNADGNR